MLSNWKTTNEMKRNGQIDEKDSKRLEISTSELKNGLKMLVYIAEFVLF